MLDLSKPFYHGTIEIYSDIIQSSGIRIIRRDVEIGVDFGPGFYLTTYSDQAIRWARDRADKPFVSKEVLARLEVTSSGEFRKTYKDKIKPKVLVYKIKDLDKWEQLEHIIFTGSSLNWRDHVCSCVNGTYDPTIKGIASTYGPLADGGRNSTDSIVIKAYPNADQLAIHNENIAREFLVCTEVISC